jgi:hypothetical protein
VTRWVTKRPQMHTVEGVLISVHKCICCTVLRSNSRPLSRTWQHCVASAVCSPSHHPLSLPPFCCSALLLCCLTPGALHSQPAWRAARPCADLQAGCD